ncbi:MAG TPA: arylsulfatase [bacterium]|nr:arylsulfatase [bacterium]HQO35082.1 arylsulfatase [bacterium]
MSKTKTLTRRTLLQGTCALGMTHSAPSIWAGNTRNSRPNSIARRPNILLIIADDQGYGDLGCHGNQYIRTPNLDRLASESVEFTRFCVSPVCAPTRASLMTGRYNYRTGVLDTYLGRAMMYPDEITLPQVLATNGYRTGIFGKWHLGDNYPMRPIDRGFQEALVHNGGGICQPADPPWGSNYQDPVLQHNGKTVQTTGYCTDIFTNAAVRFIEDNRNTPFFAYLATNAPHTPLQIDERYYKPYADMGLNEETARVYGMIENIDENVGRLLKRLDELNLRDDTIVIFMTDNGPQQSRYTAGLRGLKTTVYEGGIRVPFFLRWPEIFRAGRKIERLAAHIDIMPTLLDLCGISSEDINPMDGTSLLPLLTGRRGAFPERTLYFQWHRGDVPELYRNCAAVSDKYKLVDGDELYDLLQDPAEQFNIANENADIVSRMRSGYEKWLLDVTQTHGNFPPRIFLGSPHENPTMLTRQDWRGPRAGWRQDSLGHWEVKVTSPGIYRIRCLFRAREEMAQVSLRLADVMLDKLAPAHETTCIFDSIPIQTGDTRLETWLSLPDKTVGVDYVEITRL